MTSSGQRVAVIGGGAAGYFAAIAVAEANPDLSVTLLEGTSRPLTKVKISGGGRCNVTHNCFDPALMTKNYPRGNKELLGPFHRFQPKDTVQWFESRGVALKAESDGRMFPTTDDSSTIITCLQESARKAKVNVVLGAQVKDVRHGEHGGFVVTLKDQDTSFRRIVLATGSAPHGYAFAKALGHVIVDPVPSLFTFNVRDPRLQELSGVSFPEVGLKLATSRTSGRFEQVGPLLITHWGLSGPAVLKLSAWGARDLFKSGYKAELTIAYVREKMDAVLTTLQAFKQAHARKQIMGESPVDVPKRFWQRLVELHGSAAPAVWADATKETLRKLAEELTMGRYVIDGKGVFKEEFVTAGGVELSEVDFRSMESRICSGLFFAGEILNIDGITGGFNFQSAWTTGWIAGQAMAGDLA